MGRGERRSTPAVATSPTYSVKKKSTPLFNANQQDLTPNCAVAGTYGFFVSLYFIVTVPEFGSPSGPEPTHYQGFTITLRHTTLGRTPPDERSTRHRDLYLTTHNTHKKQACCQQDSNLRYQQASGHRPMP